MEKEKEAEGCEGPAGPQRMEVDISNIEDKKSLSSGTGTRDNGTDCGETCSERVKAVGETPADWLEPLEEDCGDEDAQSCDPDMESLAGSERSGSVAGSEWNQTGSGTVGRGRKPRRRVGDEDWEDWPILGEGWKRRVVLRRSGLSMGQMDTYYMSPKGERVRSKIELLKCIKNTVDLSNFDFRMGKFFDGEAPKRGPRKRKMGRSSPADCGFSSESSFQNESTDAADRTYSPGPMFSLGHTTQNRASPPSKQKDRPSSPAKSHDDPSLNLKTPSTTPTSQNGPSNGGFPSSRTIDMPNRSRNEPAYIPPNAVLDICVRCRNSFTGVEGQTMCGKCSRACNASKDNRNIIFRKWLPCGFCRACQLTEDCGTCASCRNGKLNPDSRRPVRCRKRKCLCPTLKRKSEEMPPATQHSSVLPGPERRLSERSETASTVSKMSAVQYSDSDEHSPFFDDDDDGDDDDDDDDEEDRVIKKQRRSCGRCKGCVSKADCGMCDFCIDKPKFGGSNKKRQKCRRRQCQREAMRHLLPDSGHTPVLTPQGWVVPGRPRPIYAYGRKKTHQSREKWDFDFSDNEGEPERRIKGPAGTLHLDRDKMSSTNYKGQPSLPLNTARSNTVTENGLQARNSKILPAVVSHRPEVGPRPVVTGSRFEGKPLRPRAEERTLRGCKEKKHTEEPEEDEAGPTITQIFSLGNSDSGNGGVDLEPELLELLSSLRRTALPMLWCPMLAEGPRLQLLQCSKASAMADTAVHVEPNFRFHISVQGQPLLPTHRLYLVHPPRLSSAAQVAALLEDLERYAVCRGFETEPPTGPEPIIQERAATCEFLVLPDAKRCNRCRSGEQKQ